MHLKSIGNFYAVLFVIHDQWLYVYFTLHVVGGLETYFYEP